MVVVDESLQEKDLLRRSRRPDEAELLLLRLLSEQNAAKVGQLMRWFGVYRRDMERLLDEYEAYGWLYRRQFIVGDDVWVWLSDLGAKFAGLGFDAGTPHYESLAHWGAINDARIFMESKFGKVEWICERRLRSVQGGKPRGYLPDALVRHRVTLEDGTVETRTYLIEAELSRKMDRQMDHKITMNSKRNDLVIYFAVPEICDVFEQRGFLKKYEKLRVYRIPDVNRMLDQPAWQVEGDPQPFRYGRRQKVEVPELSEKELDGLDFLSEQGLAPMDQLGRYLELSPAAMERLMIKWLSIGLVERAGPLVGTPSWAWLTSLGVKHSRLRLAREVPRLGSLERARAINEIRLRLTAGKPNVEWIGRNRLRREGRGYGPVGVVRVGNQEHAVDLWTSAGGQYSFERRVAQRFGEGYEGLVWFYAEGTRSEVVRFAKSMESKRLRVEPLPVAAYLEIAPPANSQDGRKRSRDSASLGSLGGELWKRLASKPPTRLHPLVPESVPLKARLAIAKEAALSEAPEILEGWVETASLRVMWLVVDAGFYRVSHTGWGWLCAEVAREDVFYIEEDAPPIDLRISRAKQGRRRPAGDRQIRFYTPEHTELTDVEWERVKPLIPPIEERTERPELFLVPDRAVLSGLLWKVRFGRGWEHLPRKIVCASWAVSYYRFQEWIDMGVWEKLKAFLTKELSDGPELDWTRVEARSTRRFNGRQQKLLRKLLDDPDYTFTLKDYREEHGITGETIRKDIVDLASEWLVIGFREDGNRFVFRAPPDLSPRLKRIERG